MVSVKSRLLETPECFSTEREKISTVDSCDHGETLNGPKQ